jgi:hypothetical protein
VCGAGVLHALYCKDDSSFRAMGFLAQSIGGCDFFQVEAGRVLLQGLRLFGRIRKLRR